MGLLMFIGGSFAALALIAMAAFMTYRLAPAETGRTAVRAEWPWLARGFITPGALWVLMNVGISFDLQPFMPSVQIAQNAGKGWLVALLGVTGVGLALIASYWAAITIGWKVIAASRGLPEETRSDFRALGLTCLIITALPAFSFVWTGGWFGLGLAALLVTLPIAGYGSTILHRVKPRPMYSRAIARMKFGKYRDAEMEIIRQLEAAENDFDGWLMLGELYACQFKDIAEAEQIILEVCDQPGATPSQISVAMHKLADWHLAVASDPAAAARALQVVSHRLPGTHLARMAELRRAQLPHTAAELQERREVRPIPLPALRELPDAESAAAVPPLAPAEATARAQELTRVLTNDPNDVSAREQLARLLAESLGQADQAVEQIELLLGIPHQPAQQRAEWLGLVAAWQLRYRRDTDAARASLCRLLNEHPNTPQAFAAQRRLSLLNAEAAQWKE